MTRTVRAFAPASVGNAGVGFDILGFALADLGDTVEITGDLFGKEKPAEIDIVRIEGTDFQLPREAEKNTAGVAMLELLKQENVSGRFTVKINKGIPISSGLGGSAASAVAAVVALNAFFRKPLPPEKLVAAAISGEAVASGAAHGDNVVPSLMGGLQLIISHDPIDFVALPCPDFYTVAVHPNIKINTREARGILKESVPLNVHSQQCAYLAGFVSSCHTGDADLMKKCLRDVVIEPQRSKLIPSFSQARQKALQAGALGFSISGAGPTVFALCANKKTSKAVEKSVVEAFSAANLSPSSWITPFRSKAAHLLEATES